MSSKTIKNNQKSEMNIHDERNNNNVTEETKKHDSKGNKIRNTLNNTSKQERVKILNQIKPGFTKRKFKPRTLFIIAALILIGLAILAQYFNLQNPSKKVDSSEILKIIKQDEFEKVVIDQQKVTLTRINDEGEEEKLVADIISPLIYVEQAKQLGISPDMEGISFENPSEFDFLSLISGILLLLFSVLIIYVMISSRNMSSGGPMMGFGDSKARLFVTGKKQTVKFDDIKGADEALDEVKEIVTFLKQPQKFIKMGARIPKGVLLIGAPGTGKTLMARAIAGEAGVPFFFTSGSEFEEMLVGTGASRVRDLFSKAKRSAPSIIFIDEIDSIAKKRGSVIHSGNSEQTLNQILVEMDGFETGTNVIIIAATNRPDVLDPAIVRPGRFDRRITIDYPDIKGREEILMTHSKNKPLAKDVDLKKIAKRTIGFSGADLENTLNEAAIIAVKANRNEIINDDIEEAAQKVLIGPAKKRAKSDKQRKIVAFHEAGHAVASFFTPDPDPIHVISIIPRGFTGGVTMYLPNEEEMDLRTESKFRSDLISLLGGRTAEKLMFDTVTTGASSDIQKATQIARSMVKKYGMSSLGYIDLEDDEMRYSQPYSDKTAEYIDDEVKRIIDQAQKESERILTENKDKLIELANMLIEKEVINGDDFMKLMNGETLEAGTSTTTTTENEEKANEKKEVISE